MTNSITPADPLAALVPSEVQRLAAKMAQDAFARVFRLSIEASPTELDATVGELAARASNWARAAGTPDGTAARLAMFVAGIDQWGLAYAQAFALPAIPGASGLIGTLRNALEPQAEAHFAQKFSALDAEDACAIDFKLELRRHIHLALWAALIEADAADAERIASTLGSLLLVLDVRMPQLGWRLIADALAHIQVRCLATLPAQGEARTADLFAALRQQLPPERASAIFTLANQATAQWQRAARDESQKVTVH
jgi:hypothetical protein